MKSKFVRPEYNKLGGGDRIPEGYKVLSISYLNSLHQLKNEDLDLVISTRYDIKFLKNPFEEYNFDFDKNELSMERTRIYGFTNS